MADQGGGAVGAADQSLAVLPPPPPLPPAEAPRVLMPIAPARPGNDLGAPSPAVASNHAPSCVPPTQRHARTVIESVRNNSQRPTRAGLEVGSSPSSSNVVRDLDRLFLSGSRQALRCQRGGIAFGGVAVPCRSLQLQLVALHHRGFTWGRGGRLGLGCSRRTATSLR